MGPAEAIFGRIFISCHKGLSDEPENGQECELQADCHIVNPPD